MLRKKRGEAKFQASFLKSSFNLSLAFCYTYLLHDNNQAICIENSFGKKAAGKAHKLFVCSRWKSAAYRTANRAIGENAWHTGQ